MMFWIGLYIGGAIASTISVAPILNDEYVAYDWRGVARLAAWHFWAAFGWPVIAAFVIGSVIREWDTVWLLRSATGATPESSSVFEKQEANDG